MSTPSPFAALPRTDDLLASAADLIATHGRDQVKAAIGAALDEARAHIARTLGEGGAPAAERDLSGPVLEAAAAWLAARDRPGPVRVVNAAGVVVHTNLGRAPLGRTALEAVVAAAGYCDLEVDLASGGRGSRGVHVDDLLARAVGAEAAMAVNSCAAALVLALAALAAGRDVPVSRGQLVEIGGSFRLPEIMAASGAHLVEVGTTNRTRASDYDVDGDVAALLTVHPSNFTQAGFVEQPPLDAVAAVARRRGVPLVHDAGSGLLQDVVEGPLAGEPSLAGSLGAGADLVLASGDKLLGGPQAGLIVGRADLVERLRRHPLARAVRLDKLRLAALNAVLRDHLRGVPSPVEVAIAGPEGLGERTAALADALGGEVRTGRTMIGGGSAPGVGVDGPVVVLPGEAHLAATLRTGSPPVVGRVQDGALWLDLRTVAPDDDATIVDAVRAARAT